jgi:type VI secretion system protein ImpM
MPGSVIPVVAAGFYGKLPARGDFVRVGLPRDFVEPWDRWLAAALSASQDRLGKDWLALFLQAPVWRFALAAGLCGAHSVLGLMLPSVDKAGRYFPLTFAALAGTDPEPASAAAWLDRCEAAGRAALADDEPPDRIAAATGVPVLSPRATRTIGSEWWTDGGATLAPTRLTAPDLPDPSEYAIMLGDGTRQTQQAEQTA